MITLSYKQFMEDKELINIFVEGLKLLGDIADRLGKITEELIKIEEAIRDTA